jgi:hypothetical protein
MRNRPAIENPEHLLENSETPQIIILVRTAKLGFHLDDIEGNPSRDRLSFFLPPVL